MSHYSANLLYKKQIARQFNRAANNYLKHCSLQATVGQTLFRKLNSLHHLNSLTIDLGCGCGEFVEKLSNISKQVIALDISQHMLQNCHCQYKMQADFDNLPLGKNTIDLIFSNMALQWSTDLQLSLPKIVESLRPQGKLAISVVTKGSITELHLALQHAFDYRAKAFVDKNCLIKTLQNAGLRLNWVKSKKYKCYYADIFQLLYSFKHIGAMHTTHKANILRSKKDFKRLQQAFKQQHLSLTYNILYIIGTKT